ncbi:MAG: ABC transporter permease [Panacagrimonas sp.]
MKRSSSGWPLVACLLAVPTLLPLAAAVSSFARLDPDLWSHLATYVLPQVLPDTLWLLLGVSLGVSVLGTALALLVTLFEFPGRRFFAWALLLPLAMPAYVLATVFVGSLDYAGAVATGLRGWGIVLPELRNGFGATLVLVAALYPYVYLVVRSSLASQGGRLLEVARSLGVSPTRAVFRVALPMAWPAVAGGTLLAAMETLADFGTVAAFNYDTFTTAIYKAWFALFSISAALQLAGVLLLLVLGLLILQGALTGARRYTQSGPPPARIALTGIAAIVASAACALILLLAFGLPALRLLSWSAGYLADLDPRLAQAGLNAVLLGLLAASLSLLVATLLGYSTRRAPGSAVTRAASRVATLGYALPGALLAVGLFVPLAGLMRGINQAFGWHMALQGSLLLMLIAYGVRFTAVAHAPVVAGLGRIRISLDESARLLGVTGLSQLRRVHVPLLRPGLAAAAALVFVDVMKEMPITLMMRPFGWDTLAVRVFELTSEGEWKRAALPSLAIVAAGLIPVWWLTRGLESHGGDRAIAT